MVGHLGKRCINNNEILNKDLTTRELSNHKVGKKGSL